MSTHAEKRPLPYTPEQLFDLVADVEKYPEFLPWCVGARVRSNDGTLIVADLVIGYKVFRERFGSRVTLFPDALKIETEYLDGPFRYMRSHWAFRPDGAGCEVDFFVDFEFKNALLQGIIGVVFNEAMLRIVRAFERRAAELYGP